MRMKCAVTKTHFYTSRPASRVMFFPCHTFVACTIKHSTCVTNWLHTRTAQSLQLQVLVGLCVIVAVSAYANFAANIPNSANVVNPCDLDGVRGQSWPGIGHRQSVGSGPRNQFGIDWARNNFVRY